MVVDFVVGQVLSGDQGSGADVAAADRLDEPTAYYLLHRNDFGLEEAPAGAVILYAISCGISDKELADTWSLISFTKGKAAEEADDEEADADAETDPDTNDDSGSKVKLKTWAQRKGRSLGYEAPGGKPIPWLGPSLGEAIDEAAARGDARVLIAPIGFLSDHVEILYDLDIEARALAQGRGLSLSRTESLNADDALVAALAAVALPLLEAA